MHIRRLAGELGLHLEDLSGRSDGHSLLYVDGRIRPARVAYHGYGRILKQLRGVARRTGYRHSYSNARAKAFDRRSAGEWIARNVAASRSRLRALMREYFAEEFGLDAWRLTATDLLYLTEGPTPRKGPGRERPLGSSGSALFAAATSWSPAGSRTGCPTSRCTSGRL